MSSDGSGMRVLVVDDDPDAASSLREMLSLMHCEAEVALDGAEALRVAKRMHPQVVFLDLDMPDADGCQVLERMREDDEQLSSAVYVCLTGSSDPEAMSRCTAAGFHRFVPKPLGHDELESILAEGRALGAIAAAVGAVQSSVRKRIV